MKPPSKEKVDRVWQEYELECEKLSQMRNPISTSTELEIQLQLQVTENLLQHWVDSTEMFRTTLN